MKNIVLGILLVFYLLILFRIEEPPLLSELKRRYEIIRTGLPHEDKWKLIKEKCAIITGTDEKTGIVGSNVNKGYEIYICLDGDDIKAPMYVFLHELAHLTVKEYDHSQTFWENFRKLREICEHLDVYEKVVEQQYCGETVKE
jgi:hypothetical protein